MTTFQEPKPRPADGPVMEQCTCRATIQSDGTLIQGPFRKLYKQAWEGENLIRHHDAACPVHAWMNVLAYPVRLVGRA